MDQKWDDLKVTTGWIDSELVTSLIKSDIPLMGIENKIQILNGKNSENKMSDVVLQSVIPSNLSSQQVIDYKNGLQELANEFQTMARIMKPLDNSAAEKNITNPQK